MVSFAEVVNRALSGPVCSENDFNLRVFVPKLREVIRKYDIRYDPENPIPADDGLADRLFMAGMEFYRDVGTYCVDSERIIKFSAEELNEAIASAPIGPILGTGKEAKRLIARRPESSEPPWCSVGAAGGGASNEEILASLVQWYAAIPLADSITTPSLATINGQEVVAGTPLEIEGAIRTVVLSKEAIRRAGRPGLPIINGIATAVSGMATLAGSQFGLGAGDAWEIASLAELKINFDLLNKIAYLLNTGLNWLSETGTLLGGYAGGPEGTAVVTVAYNLEGILVKRATFHHPFPTHFAYGCTTCRNTLWALSVSSQAISRNSHFPLLDLGYVAAGPVTEMCLYETAAWVIAAVVSGGSIEAEGTAKATHVDYMTPLEPQFATEVAHATTGMTRKEANEVVKSLLDRYEDSIPHAPIGQRYQDCFDVARGIPKPEYLELYHRVREELESMGLRWKTILQGRAL
ncbi:MAG: monomethylamine:corrinoid methyltransferase [Chloroflexi bacterium]|nr:monomethylamine:corrinoid methyltransferase [Chloroflexota bacterium]MCL5074991.1 monomethylamine:corrinoid methyltransferase [Chloroflexota bacterium]